MKTGMVGITAELWNQQTKGGRELSLRSSDHFSSYSPSLLTLLLFPLSFHRLLWERRWKVTQESLGDPASRILRQERHWFH